MSAWQSLVNRRHSEDNSSRRARSVTISHHISGALPLDFVTETRFSRESTCGASRFHRTLGSCHGIQASLQHAMKATDPAAEVGERNVALNMYPIQHEGVIVLRR